MGKQNHKSKFIDALSRLTVRVGGASDSEAERWWDGFERYVDRMMDTETLGIKNGIKDPRR
jgi:hypothetical protein